MKLSVVIVNYNTWEHLKACLPALLASSLKPEIIVVDNDGSASQIPALFPGVKLLPQTENQWFCGGNNIGIDAARSDYVLLLNPDTIPQTGALETMVEFLDAHPDYAGATLQMRYPNGEIQRTGSRIPTYEFLLLNHTPLRWVFSGWQKRINNRHWYGDWARDSSRDIEVLPGSCLMMRRGNFQLDGDFLLYFPEDDLARRFRGAKFRFLADSYIIHNEKSVTKSWLATRVYFRDLLVYTRKHHGAAAWLLLRLLSRPLYWGMALRAKIRP
jgi:GT2 family glycosyltransferase